MTRLTITLSEPRYRALKETPAQRGKTIGQLVDESLDFYGVKSREQDGRTAISKVFWPVAQAKRAQEAIKNIAVKS